MSFSDALSERTICRTIVVRVRRGPPSSIAPRWSHLWWRSSWGSSAKKSSTVGRRSHANEMSRQSWSGRTWTPSPSVTWWGERLYRRKQLLPQTIFLYVRQAAILLLDYRRFSLNCAEKTIELDLSRGGIVCHFVTSWRTEKGSVL